MKYKSFFPIAAFVFTLASYSRAFSPILSRDAPHIMPSMTRSTPRPRKRSMSLRRDVWVLYSNDNRINVSIKEENDQQPMIVRGFEQDEISDEAWENIETGEPPKLLVMKEVSPSKQIRIMILFLLNLFSLITFSLAFGNQHLYILVGWTYCNFSNGQLCSGSGVVGPSDRDEGNWNVYGRLSFIT